MRDMGMEMGGEYARLDSVLFGQRLSGGIEECAGGCGRLVLDAEFCRDCMQLNRQMEAKRMADAERGKVFARMKRSDMGVEEVPEPRDEKVPFTEDPWAQFAVGLAVTFAGFVALWYGIPLVVGVGLWLSAHGI
jgi:hypothetical protein